MTTATATAVHHEGTKDTKSGPSVSSSSDPSCSSSLCGESPSPSPARRPRRKIRQRTLEELQDRVLSMTLKEASYLTGVPYRTLLDYTRAQPKEKRLPHTRIRGVKGRRGLIIVEKADLIDWLAWWKWRTDLAEIELISPEYDSFPAWRAKQQQRQMQKSESHHEGTKGTKSGPEEKHSKKGRAA